MGKTTKYAAKVPDENGIIPYTDEEHSVWHDLIVQQTQLIENRVCKEYIDGLDMLNLPTDRIPQPGEISKILMEKTGWEVAPVPALINFDLFFRLLSEKKFPAASFIRSRDEMKYLQEPDIFHEIFGHTAMLTHPAFADFTEAYGKAGVKASKADRVLLARMYWFTVEFGLIDSGSGIRSYGGGINSSPGELVYALESDKPERRPFKILDVLRTPYRIDIYQPIYYVLNDFNDMLDLSNMDLISLIQEARALGEFAPTYPPKQTAA